MDGSGSMEGAQEVVTSWCRMRKIVLCLYKNKHDALSSLHGESLNSIPKCLWWRRIAPLYVDDILIVALLDSQPTHTSTQDFSAHIFHLLGCGQLQCMYTLQVASCEHTSIAEGFDLLSFSSPSIYLSPSKSPTSKPYSQKTWIFLLSALLVFVYYRLSINLNTFWHRIRMNDVSLFN